jgi:hypothetical protein
MAASVKPVELQAETVRAFDVYISAVEAAFQETLHCCGTLFSAAEATERDHRLRAGEILAELWAGKNPVPAPRGLIHDWVGAVIIPGVTVASTLACVQDYDNHKNIYQPDVVDSRLISHQGDDFTIYLRLRKKKVLTVVLDTDHDVHYSGIETACCYCRSRTTRVCEVQDAGEPSEKILPADTGYGFLWRLYSFWKFHEMSCGTLVECRAISLTRDVPAALKWIVNPIVRSLPKESLCNTLAATRRALAPVRSAPTGIAGD